MVYNPFCGFFSPNRWFGQNIYKRHLKTKWDVLLSEARRKTEDRIALKSGAIKTHGNYKYQTAKGKHTLLLERRKLTFNKDNVIKLLKSKKAKAKSAKGVKMN